MFHQFWWKNQYKITKKQRNPLYSAPLGSLWRRVAAAAIAAVAVAAVAADAGVAAAAVCDLLLMCFIKIDEKLWK